MEGGSDVPNRLSAEIDHAMEKYTNRKTYISNGEN